MGYDNFTHRSTETRVRTLLFVAAIFAIPAWGQQSVKRECRDLDGTNQFIQPDEVIVPVADGYQVCRAAQVKTPTEVPKRQSPVPAESAPAATGSTAQSTAHEGNIRVHDLVDFNNEDAAKECKSRPDGKVESIQTGSILSCSDWLTIRTAKLYPQLGAPTAEVQTAAEVGVRSKSQLAGQVSVKTISFAVAIRGGVEYYVPSWVQKWVKKHAKKYPGVVFTQEKTVGDNSFLIVFSNSANALSGFEPVTHTSTSTSTSPVSGSGTLTDYSGDQWNYTYDGTVTTTTTTQTTENEAYTIQSNTLYATAFDSRGSTVSKHWHIYSTKSGGDAYNSLGYNLGNALGAINARGRLLGDVAKDIEKSR